MAGESVRTSWLIITATFRRFYDQLGLSIFLSIVWFICAFGPGVYSAILVWNQPYNLITYLIAGLCLTFISGPVTSAVYFGADVIIAEDNLKVRMLWDAFRKYYKTAAAATAIMLLVLVVLVIDMLWFGQYKGFISWLGYFWWYFIGCWGMVAMFMFPFICYKPNKARQVLKKAVLITLDNVVVSFLIFVATGLIIYASWRLRAPLPFLMAGLLALMHQATFRRLMEKYDDGETNETDEKDVEE